MLQLNEEVAGMVKLTESIALHPRGQVKALLAHVAVLIMAGKLMKFDKGKHPIGKPK